MNLGYENNKVSCLKQGGKMSNFCLKQGQVLKTLGSSPTTRASDRLRKKSQISREFLGQTSPKSNQSKNSGFCGCFQGTFS